MTTRRRARTLRLRSDRTAASTIIAQAEDAPGAVDAALREQPDLALLDVNMPGSGLAAAWEITARLPATRVVMLTISRDDSHVFAALRAGAAGYLLKDTETERLPDALRDVMAGEAALPVTLVTRLVEEFRDRAPRRRALMPSREGEPRLTSREWEVLELMRRKMTTAQIARTLVVSPATVRSHVAAILRKLRVPDRDAAVRLLDNPTRDAAHGEFLAGAVGELAGVSGTTIGQWARWGYIRASQSTGDPHVYSVEDVTEAAMVKALLDRGVSRMMIRRAISQLGVLRRLAAVGGDARGHGEGTDRPARGRRRVRALAARVAADGRAAAAERCSSPA